MGSSQRQPLPACSSCCPRSLGWSRSQSRGCNVTGCTGDSGRTRCRQEPSGLLLTKCSLCSQPIDLFSFHLVYFVSIIVITLITQWEALRAAMGSQWGTAPLCTCWVASHQQAQLMMCQLVKPQTVVTNLCHGSGRCRANLLAQACAGSAYPPWPKSA